MRLSDALRLTVGFSLTLVFVERTVLSTEQATSTPAQGTAVCLSYEPVVVELTGAIVRETFPGPPNYENVKEGDQPEVYWLLNLPQPICVDEDKANPDLNSAQVDIRKIQLVFMDPKAYKSYRSLVGKKVVAKGTLFGSLTIHHRTSVLLTVTSIAKAE
jgi:hypothetical protein